jgi:hypothetical protein
MANDLYQTMLQEQAKEEAAADLTPIQNHAKVPDGSTQGWTNDSNIQYNMQEEISAVPIAQQEYLRQFWDETKNRFSAVKLLFDTQPYGSFQPAFAVANGKNYYGNDSNDAANRINKYLNKLNNTILLFTAQDTRSSKKKQTEKKVESKYHLDERNPNTNNHYSWGHDETLEDHYTRHGNDVGAISALDYAKKANVFYHNRANYQIKVDSKGIIRVYDPNTNIFGSYKPDGTTRTLFAPAEGQSYFDSQPGNLSI